MAAVVTHRVTTPDTGNLANVSGAFVPASNDLLVVFVTIEGNTADHALSSSIGGFTFTLVRKELFRTSADQLAIYVSNALVSDTSSQTVTIPAPGSGSILSVYSVSGIAHAGTLAVRGQGGQSNKASGAPAPAADLTQAALTTNAVIAALANATNPAGMTAPAVLGESQDTGYTTGAVTGLETAFANSGVTAQTITWGGNSASISAAIVAEIQIGTVNTETGSGVTGFVGSGDKPHAPVTYTKQGIARLGRQILGNTGQLGMVGSGVSQKVAGAAGNTYTKQNSGIAAFVGSATDQATRIETGAGALTATAGGSSAETQANSGSGVLVAAASGTDTSIRIETGGGVGSRIAASALDFVIYTETGAGIRGHVGSGASQKTGGAVKTGSGIEGFAGGAADQATFTETGGGVGARVAGSALDFVTYTETGAGVSARTSSATDEATRIEAGSGILSAVAGGAKVVGGGATYVKAGLGQMGRIPAIQKTGAATLGLVGSGASLKVPGGKTGTGITGRVGSGAKAVILSKTGAGISSRGQVEQQGAQIGGLLLWMAGTIFSTVGAKQVLFGEIGAGVRGHVGSGAKVMAGGGATYTKQNSGVLTATAAAIDAELQIDSGAGVLTATASGSKIVGGGATYTKQNTGILALVGSAADAVTTAESGSGVSSRLASGTKAVSYGETGTGALNAAAGGTSFKAGVGAKAGFGLLGSAGSATDQTTYTELGTAPISTRNSSGQDAVAYIDSGTGVTGRVGSGAKQTQQGATYTKTGTATLTGTAGGLRVRLIGRTGTGALDRSATGRDVVQWNKRGFATLTMSASGERKYGVTPGAVTITKYNGTEIDFDQGTGAGVTIDHGRGALVR